MVAEGTTTQPKQGRQSMQMSSLSKYLMSMGQASSPSKPPNKKVNKAQQPIFLSTKNGPSLLIDGVQ
jgi:hypothetical protein